MDQRQTLYNLVITVAIIATVALGALIFRNKHPNPVPVKRAPAAAALPVAQPLLSVPAAGDKPVEKNFLTFPKVKFVEDAANQADSVRIHLPDGEYVFAQYFVRALDNNDQHLARVQDAAQYFGKVSNNVVIEAGREAMEYTRDLLNNHTFMVLTRWEKTPDGRYYALIWVEYEKDKWKYLSELLVRRGYARIDGLTTPIPNTKLNEDDYLQLLQMGAKYARQNRLGIWSKAKN